MHASRVIVEPFSRLAGMTIVQDTAAAAPGTASATPCQPGEYLEFERHYWLDRVVPVRVNVVSGLCDDEFELVVTAYLRAALWCGDDEHGLPLDCSHDVHEFTPDAWAAARLDVHRFVSRVRGLLPEVRARLRVEGDSVQGLDLLGHDLWLARTGAGGFHTRMALGALGGHLTDAALALGPVRVVATGCRELRLV